MRSIAPYSPTGLRCLNDLFLRRPLCSLLGCCKLPPADPSAAWPAPYSCQLCTFRNRERELARCANSARDCQKHFEGPADAKGRIKHSRWSKKCFGMNSCKHHVGQVLSLQRGAVLLVATRVGFSAACFREVICDALHVMSTTRTCFELIWCFKVGRRRVQMNWGTDEFAIYQRF